MCSGASVFLALPGVNPLLASMNSTSVLAARAPPFSRARSNTRIATGMPVVGNSSAGSPITASSRFSSIMLLADAPLGGAAEQHAVRHHDRDAARSRSRATSTMCVMNA